MKKFCLSLISCMFALGLATVSPAMADTGGLDWLPNTESDLAGYKVYQSTVTGVYTTTPLATLLKVTTYNFTLPALTVDTRYFFTITAYDLAGNESPKSNEVTKVALVSPGTPVLTAVAVSPTSITVTWPTVLDVAGLPTLIDIRSSIAPLTWGTAPSTSCFTSPCTVVGLTPNTSYAFAGVVWRTNSTGGKVFGAISTPITVSTLPIDLPPTAPVGVTVR